MPFIFETTVKADWIDYNGHMRDCYYGLVFSLAVDALQDEIGFDAAYRKRTGCTIYLVEDHKIYLREVKEGDALSVTTYVLGVDGKLFHLHMRMTRDGTDVCVGEFLELHIQQHPKPHATMMPDDIRAKLKASRLETEKDVISYCSRRIELVR